MTTAVQLAQSAAPGVSLGFKNRIINGGMTIDQRNAGASVTPTASAYTLDRWSLGITQASKASVQQSSTAPAGFVNSLVATSLSAYSVGASDLFVIQQLIEGFNIADLGWGTANAKTVTLSFWVRSSLTGTFGGVLNNTGASRSYPFTYTISAANTWEQKTVTIAGDTSGTWLTTNGLGIGVRFSLGVGSTYSGTAGAWAGTTYYSATGATSVVGTNGATFYITGVQLEVGTAATSFEFRDYGRELIMCQRYFFKQYSSQAGAYGWFAVGFFTSSSTAQCYTPFPVVMRTVPSIAFSAANTFLLDGTTGYTPTTVNSNYTTTYGTRLAASGFSGAAAGSGCGFGSQNPATATIEYSAEF